MLTAFDQAITQITQQRKSFVALAKKAMSAGFKEIFDTFPTVEGIRFVGYTPYFNDGDACEYSLGEITAKLTASGPLDMACSGYNCKNIVGNADKHCNQCGKKQPTLAERAEIWHDSYDLKKSDPALRSTLSLLDKKLRGIEDEVKEIFGDHAQITVSLKDGQVVFNVSKYDHE
jgi:hypothetical protein